MLRDEGLIQRAVISALLWDFTAPVELLDGERQQCSQEGQTPLAPHLNIKQGEEVDNRYRSTQSRPSERRSWSRK